MDGSPTPNASTVPIQDSGSITVRDALKALTALNQDIVRLSYGDVVIRRGYQNLKTVRLLSGGIGGRDLSQAIFVGKGMLTAAILGNDKVPSSREILHTLRELNEGDKCGVFVIIQKNPDLFNFGLAVERAKTDCFERVKLLVIDDDKTNTGERYSCGYILLSKILGAMAEQGAFFDDIYKVYNQIVDDIITVSLNYIDEDPQPHQALSLTLIDFEATIRGAMSTNTAVAAMSAMELQQSASVVALINTPKDMPRLEELGLMQQVIKKYKALGVCVLRVYYGNFVAVAHNKALLTTMKIYDPKIIQYLDAKCDAPGWLHVTQFLPEISLDNEFPGVLTQCGKLPVELKGPTLRDVQAKTLKTAVQFAANALISCEQQLDIMDRQRSRGNVGSRFKILAESLNRKLNSNRLPIDCPYAFLKKLSVIAESALGGTLGSLYGILFEDAANYFEGLSENETVTARMWARAFSVGCNSIEKCSYNAASDLTMYATIKKCELAIHTEIQKGKDYLHCFGIGVCVAEEEAQKTQSWRFKYPDAGAHAVGIWMRAIFEGVKLMSSNFNQEEF